MALFVSKKMNKLRDKDITKLSIVTEIPESILVKLASLNLLNHVTALDMLILKDWRHIAYLPEAKTYSTKQKINTFGMVVNCFQNLCRFASETTQFM